MEYAEFIETIDFLEISRAYKLLKLYSQTEVKSRDLEMRFSRWLLNDGNSKEKDIALRMVFEESMQDIIDDDELDRIIRVNISRYGNERK